MNKKESQKKKVIQWLDQHGSITTFEAVTELHIMSLPKRIQELRKDGYLILTHWTYLIDGSKYGTYELISQEGGSECLAD